MAKSGTVCSIGINDADYPLIITVELPYKEGKRQQKILWRCPYYARWTAMLRRCCSARFKNKYQTYNDVTCSKEWLLFSNFKSWMETQDWKGKDLDKDLLVYQNNIYSPEACCFLEHNINTFLRTNGKTRGEYPLGVSFSNRDRLYMSKVKIGCGEIKHLGCFKNPQDAHKAWQKAKAALAFDLALNQTDERIKQGLMRVYEKILSDYEQDLETVNF
jgi:hypothetical protein